jgi:coproporphyrinogen III oxidase
MSINQSIVLDKETIEQWFKRLQDQICSGLENIEDSAKFKEDLWERKGGGGGRTRTIQKGKVIEKGGVNFSAVFGEAPEKILNALNLPKSNFYATGVSIVIHPVNPWCPIIHMNVRYLEMENGTRWFGGGIDLTPHYILKEDAVYFHSELKVVCDKYGKDYYKEFKQWADEYFFIPHRNETRGIGGIFFDRLSQNDSFSLPERFEFVKAVGKSFLPIYSHIIQKNKNIPFGENEKKWQYLRRGRYVEFNLVYDKGTKFGLDTEGRTESILMSLPPLAEWEYSYKVIEGSKEEETLSLLQKHINWI